MTFYCGSRYIALPIRTGADSKTLLFYEGNKLIFDLTVSLDAQRPDYYAYYDVNRYRGRLITVRCEPDTSFHLIEADTPKPNETESALRPKVHFTPLCGWLNDPNGLIFDGARYHMFYQCNPVGTVWGNMHWAHAASRDLLHWQDEGLALFPDDSGTMFSGSAVLDVQNVLGLAKDESDTIVLFYTAAGGTSRTSANRPFTQCMACSTDGGKTFQKYGGNPVLPVMEPGNRDPKVFYHAPTKQYVMALYVNRNKFALLTSQNLTQWEKTDTLTVEGDAECADLYPLPVDGDHSHIKWVFTGAAGRYIIGSFDGRRFHRETEVQALHQGKLSYAAQTFANCSDGRIVRMAWNRFEMPAKTFAGSMTVPCEMSLRSTQNGLRLCAYPTGELQTLYGDSATARHIVLQNGVSQSLPLSAAAYDILFDAEAAPDACIEVSLFGITLCFDFAQQQVRCVEQVISFQKTPQPLSVRLICDTNGIELFLDGGAVYDIIGAMADSTQARLTFTAKAGRAVLHNVKAHALQQIF